VTHEGTVGPYETVTLHANVPNALPAWLTAHNYNIDPSVTPIIDAYTSEGFDFIALRLLPDQGVQQMKPVRVVTPGMSASLPLRMVAAGTGPFVAITLFVIGEGRWEAQNFANATVDPSTLTWDFGTQSSNYSTQRLAVMAQNGGRTWNTAFSNQGSLLSQDLVNGGSPASITVQGQFYPTFGQAYVAQGMADGETNTSACTSAFSTDADSLAQVDGSCLGQQSGGGGTGGGGTGGAGTGGGTSAPCTVPPGDIDAADLACGGLDDIAMALVGLHPHDVWLTRLEGNLPRTALAADLVLQASASQQAVSNVFNVSPANATGNPCVPPSSGALGAAARKIALRNRVAMSATIVLAMAAALARRQRRRWAAAVA
jgi:hypothetical protein